MSIKKINITDLEECLSILHKSYEERDKNLKLDNSVKRHTQITYEELKNMYENNIEMYTYNINNKTIGFISFDVKEDYIKIKDIVVLPEYQSKGIGTNLLDFIKDYSIKLNIHSLRLGLLYNNEKLRKWYEKYGFNIVDIITYDKTIVGYMELKI